METGLKAWIANHEFDDSDNKYQIELPGGWHWDIYSDLTGYLITPDNMRCVGYDLFKKYICFGQDGMTEAQGLNPWTIQEMGEKFARENFMDEKTAKEYDTFAKQRGMERKQYEKGERDVLKGVIMMELNHGKWTAHVDTDAVMSIAGIETKAELTKEEGIRLFNQISEARHVMPLCDPMGYMILDNNVYDYIKEQYDFQYNNTIDNIDAGFINGTGRGCEVVLEKLDSVVCKNIKEYCIPNGVFYKNLRFLAVTPEIKDAVNDFVKHRVTQTVNYEKKRDHSEEALAMDRSKFIAAGEILREQITNAALPPLDVQLDTDDSLKIE